mmetsp:Transcript_33172/g.50050  ORF Transcript_33172/g.50050 Transcript_33172/m.50050 type:complete len:212 (+) Transcript_33172:177-812(+)
MPPILPQVFNDVQITAAKARKVYTESAKQGRRGQVNQFKSKKGSDNYIKTFAISEDLTNSAHIDASDDSHSFALWYPTKEKARTWFLFPKASIAIECAARPVIVCWDGRMHQHCSCTVNKGMVSVCGLRKQILSNHKVVIHRHLHQKKNYCQLWVGTKVACIKKKENKKMKKLVGIVVSLDYQNQLAEIQRPNMAVVKFPFNQLVSLPDQY